MLMCKKSFFTPSVCKARPFSAAKDYAHVCIEYKLITVTHSEAVHASFSGRNSIVKWKFSVLLSLSFGKNSEEAFVSYSSLLTER